MAAESRGVPDYRYDPNLGPFGIVIEHEHFEERLQADLGFTPDTMAELTINSWRSRRLSMRDQAVYISSRRAIDIYAGQVANMFGMMTYEGPNWYQNMYTQTLMRSSYMAAADIVQGRGVPDQRNHIVGILATIFGVNAVHMTHPEVLSLTADKIVLGVLAVAFAARYVYLDQKKVSKEASKFINDEAAQKRWEGVIRVQQ